MSRILSEAGPVAFEALLRAHADLESDRIRAKARPLIYSCGTAAAGAGAVPVPIVGVGGLAGVIATMLRALARRYQVEWTPRTLGQFSSAVGGGALLGVFCDTDCVKCSSSFRWWELTIERTQENRLAAD